MALDTPNECRDAVIYQCFVRNHGPNGTLADVTADLPRIAALGTTVLYLMPIQPIGVEGRKGSLGSPYAISDYRAIDPALGTEQDFADLVAAADELGLRVMLDVVFNHTSPDSVLVREHPEFFTTDENGVPVTTVPEWSDIIDLAHPNPQLTDYLIETLQGWVDRGVRGFRCDVASLVPLSFWQAARAAIDSDVWWLTESPHPKWVTERREANLPTASDTEMFDSFDLAYQYDIWSIWQSVVRGTEPISRFLEMVRWQGATLPAHALKLRFVENHDNYRIMTFARTRESALAWTALMAFLPGPLMIYAGQESAAERWPSLFEPDPIDWGDYALTDFLTQLIASTRTKTGQFRVVSSDPPVLAWIGDEQTLVGAFDVQGTGLPDLPPGDALLNRPEVRIVALPGRHEFSNEHSTLLDVFLHVETAESELD